MHAVHVEDEMLYVPLRSQMYIFLFDYSDNQDVAGDVVLIEYVRAVKGQAQNIKETLPFLCPDVGYIEKMLSDSKAIVILAKDKSNIVGVVGGWLQGTPSGYKDEDKMLREHGAYSEAHLDWIAVKEEYRERGVGANLVQKACDWARKNRKEKIWVEASKDKAEFYKKQSFMLIGRFIGEKEEELYNV